MIRRRKGVLPEAARKASLGCGNATTLAELKKGEIVLDFGSWGRHRRAAFSSARWPNWRGLLSDMTDEMLSLAEQNKRESGLTYVEFLKGETENVPLPDSALDVIISNCVINLSGDKHRVLQEAFRVLKPGGRFAVSDIVV